MGEQLIVKDIPEKSNAFCIIGSIEEYKHWQSMKLSIVATLYKSSKYINEFNSRISHEVKKITDDYELIFVDDGSPDDSITPQQIKTTI